MNNRGRNNRTQSEHLLAGFRECTLCRAVFLVLAGGLLTSAGCVSKTKANAEARAAYEAGVRETMLKLQQVRGPTVIVSGPVKNTMIPWTPELTLARAILSAGYLAPKDPSHISIIRNSEQIPVDPKSLLAGDDVPLASGDIIKIEP